jgi:hypothetical protein
VKRGQPGNTEKEAFVDAEKRLPDRPNIRHLKLQAGDLRNALASGDVDAFDRLKRVQPLSALAGLPDPKLTVTESLLVIAREYGFPSWRALKQFVETRPSAAEPAMASQEAVPMNTVTESKVKTTTAKKVARRGRTKPARIIVDGDWSPPLREVDIIERRSDIEHDILPAMLLRFDLKVNRKEGYYLRDFKNLLRGRGLSAPAVILKVDGPEDGTHGIFLNDARSYSAEHRDLVGVGTMTPREIAGMARFNGRVVVCLGSGLGTPQMADAFIKGGAAAYLGTAENDRGKPAARLFFAMRFFYELSQHGATVKESWARARGLGRDAARFRLFVPQMRAGKATATMVPAPSMPAEYTSAYKGERTAGKADRRPSIPELDIISVEGFPAGNTRALWAVLDQWGVRVNLHPCRTPEEVKRCLAGRGLRAPLVLLESHGSPDKKGRFGIVLGENKNTGGKRPKAEILDVNEMGRLIRLPGRTLLTAGCGLGSPQTAEAFLKGGLKAFIGAVEPVNGCAEELFVRQFYYELAVNGATVRQACERARLADDQTRLFRFYPGDEKVRNDAPLPRPVLTAPALIESFEGDTANTYEGNWDVGFFNYRPAFVLPAPGSSEAGLAQRGVARGKREGYAYKLNFDYTKKAWPAVELRLPKGGQRWTGAKGLSLDVYVPHDMPLARPLKCLFCVVGEKHEFSRPDLALSRGWNHVVLPFDSTDWRGKPVGTKESHQESFDLEKLSPVKWFWIAFPGEHRREEGSVYLDNLRLI